MKILKTILCVFFVTQVGIVYAQETKPLSMQVETAVKQAQPSWKLIKRTSSKNGQYVSYKWKSGASSIDALLVFNSSKELAVDRFKTLPTDLELSGLSMKPSETLLRLGDEAWSWNNIYDRRISGILLRKGRVVANISGMSKESVTRFASQIVDALPPE